MKGRISSGFNSDSSRGRSTWKSWTWGGPGWALGAGPPGRWGIGSSEGWAGRGAVKKYWCRRAWGQQQGTAEGNQSPHHPSLGALPREGGHLRTPPSRLAPTASECSSSERCSRGWQNQEPALEKSFASQGCRGRQDKGGRYRVQHMTRAVAETASGEGRWRGCRPAERGSTREQRGARVRPEDTECTCRPGGNKQRGRSWQGQR